jgi:hypothetical protein
MWGFSTFSGGHSMMGNSFMGQRRNWKNKPVFTTEAHLGPIKNIF